MKTKPFKFDMGATVSLKLSGETGHVIGRAQYDVGDNDYRIRYLAADGRQCDSWWQESAIKATPK